MLQLWCDRLTFLSLCLLIFVLPATIGGVSIFMVAAVVFFLIGVVARRLAAVARGRDWRENFRVWAGQGGLALSLVFLVGINFLAAVWSEYPQLSRKAFFGKVLGHVVIYLAVRRVFNTPHRLRILLNVFFVSAVVICLDALLQLWCGYDFFKKAPLVEGRVSAAFNHPNGLAAYLVLVLPVMYVLVVTAWRKWRESGTCLRLAQALFCLGGFLLGVVVLGLTYSRGAWLGFLVAVAAFLWLHRRWAAVWFAVIGLLALLAFVPLLKAYRHVSLIAENLPPVSSSMPSPAPRETAPASSPEKTVIAGAARQEAPPPLMLPPGESQRLRSQDWLDKLYIKFVRAGIGGSDRLIYWRDALKIVRDHPWTGTGLNTYAKVIRAYNNDRALYAHNSYLQMAAELGVFGLGIFLWFLFVHLAYGIRNALVMDPQTAFLWTAVLAGFIGFLLHGFFDTIFYSVQHRALLWFGCGLLAAGRALAERKDKEQACR